MKIFIVSPMVFLISIVPMCHPYPGSHPIPADDVPPELIRLDSFPGAVVCGTFDIIGNISDEAQPGIDPTGVAKVWVTLDDNMIEEFTPQIGCPVSVEFTFTNIEITETGFLALHAEDCEGNGAILEQVIVDNISDDVDPVPSFTYPTDGETIYGSSWIFEVGVVSDNEDLVVCLEIDGLLIGCDGSAPFKWLVENLENGSHIAMASATDECGFYGEAEILFNVNMETRSVRSPKGTAHGVAELEK